MILFALSLALAVVSGLAISARARGGALGAFLVATLHVMAATWTAGVLLHSLRPGIILAVQVAFTLAALIASRWRRPAADAAPEPTTPWPLWLKLLLLVAAAETAWTVVRAFAFPPYAWDSLTYHLPAAALWVQQGFIGHVEWNQIWTNVYPQNAELLMTWCFAFVRSQTLAQLVQLPFALAGAVATARLGRQAGLGANSARFAGLAFYLAPIVLAQSGVAYVDLVFAGLFLIAVCFAVEQRPGWAGVALGLLAGVKSAGVGYAAVTALIAAALAPRGRRLRTILAMALPVALLGSYWYLRTWVQYGNPVYPITVPHLFAGQGSLVNLVELDNTPQAFRGHPLYALFAAWWELGNYWNYDVRAAGFGPLWPIACLPAIPYFLARYKKPAWRLLAYLGAGFLVQPMHWWSRFSLAFFALGAVALGAVLEAEDRVLRRGAVALSLLLVLLGSALGTGRQPGLGPRRFLQASPADIAHRETRLGVYYGPEFRWLEDVDPQGVRIAAVQVYFPYVLLGEHLQNRVTFTLDNADYAMAPEAWTPPAGWEPFAASPGWRVYRRSGS